MTRIIAMRGYSSAGKSVLARQIADEIGGVVVNRDYFRKMLLGEWYTGHRGDEDRVTIAEEASVKGFLQAGISTVVDATHLAPQFLRKWAKLAGQLNVGFEVIDVRTDVEECVLRDLRRMENGERYVGEKVIRDQAKRFPMDKWPTVAEHGLLNIEPVTWVDNLTTAVIADLDGTCAIHQGRSPYDYSRVDEDAPNLILRTILDKLSGPHEIIYCSGRDDTCREATQKWLDRYNFPKGRLLMRDTVNDRTNGQKWADRQVKLRLFNEEIRDKFNVVAVFDDRLSVCRLWHALGLQLFRVGDPEADF